MAEASERPVTRAPLEIRARQKVPTTVVTGFLGAGKTTLIRHLIETAGGRRLALIVNEFGEQGVDGELLRGCGVESCGEGDIVELANGCICCTVADDFLPTMRALLERAAPPEHIIVETSGLALPKPLIQAFDWPEVRTRATVDGVIAVVDGAAVAEGLFAADPEAVQRAREADPALDHESPLEELFEEQLVAADLIVLNKSDLLDESALERARGEVRRHARDGVGLMAARHGALDAATLLGLGAAAEDDLASRPSHHDGAEAHEHDDFASFTLELPPLADLAAFTARLAEAIGSHEILRVKGFLALEGRPMRAVLQAVGLRLQHYFDRPWRTDEVRRTRLVVIGPSDMDEQAIRASLGA